MGRPRIQPEQGAQTVLSRFVSTDDTRSALTAPWWAPELPGYPKGALVATDGHRALIIACPVKPDWAADAIGRPDMSRLIAPWFNDPVHFTVTIGAQVVEQLGEADATWRQSVSLAPTPNRDENAYCIRFRYEVPQARQPKGRKPSWYWPKGHFSVQSFPSHHVVEDAVHIESNNLKPRPDVGWNARYLLDLASLYPRFATFQIHACVEDGMGPWYTARETVWGPALHLLMPERA